MLIEDLNLNIKVFAGDGTLIDHKQWEDFPPTQVNWKESLEKTYMKKYEKIQAKTLFQLDLERADIVVLRIQIGGLPRDFSINKYEAEKIWCNKKNLTAPTPKWTTYYDPEEDDTIVCIDLSANNNAGEEQHGKDQ